MAKVKPLNVKQLAVIDDIFEGQIEESDMLEKHNISRKLYDRWLADESFNQQLARRTKWEYRRIEIMLARSAKQAVSNLMELTKSKQSETARKACIDIITMRANILADTRSSGTQILPSDNPKSPFESQNFSHETAGKLLAVLAEEKILSTS